MTAQDRKTLLITGASRGIGAATARMAAGRGWNVAVNYVRDAAAAEKVVADCRGAGAEAFAVQADMGREEDIGRLFAETKHRFGALDGFVNNAGIAGRTSRLDEAPPALIREIIDVNVTGAILAARAAIPLMSTKHGARGGAMVNVSSVAATLGSPGSYVWYAASKGAIDSFTKGLALELAADRVRVNAIAPGLIDTEIHLTSGDPDRLKKLAPVVPWGRVAQADEVADPILWLLSDASGYVTGEVLRVAGGR